jgi:hypothetical protein
MKAHTATSPQHTATFGVNADIAGRIFHLLYNHTDIAIVDVPGFGEFLSAETALALANLITGDEHLVALIQQRELGGAA